MDTKIDLTAFMAAKRDMMETMKSHGPISSLSALLYNEMAPIPKYDFINKKVKENYESLVNDYQKLYLYLYQLVNSYMPETLNELYRIKGLDANSKDDLENKFTLEEVELIKQMNYLTQVEQINNAYVNPLKELKAKRFEAEKQYQNAINSHDENEIRRLKEYLKMIDNYIEDIEASLSANVLMGVVTASDIGEEDVDHLKRYLEYLEKRKLELENAMGNNPSDVDAAKLAYLNKEYQKWSNQKELYDNFGSEEDYHKYAEAVSKLESYDEEYYSYYELYNKRYTEYVKKCFGLKPGDLEYKNYDLNLMDEYEKEAAIFNMLAYYDRLEYEKMVKEGTLPDDYQPLPSANKYYKLCNERYEQLAIVYKYSYDVYCNMEKKDGLSKEEKQNIKNKKNAILKNLDYLYCTSFNDEKGINSYDAYTNDRQKKGVPENIQFLDAENCFLGSEYYRRLQEFYDYYKIPYPDNINIEANVKYYDETWVHYSWIHDDLGVLVESGLDALRELKRGNIKGYIVGSWATAGVVIEKAIAGGLEIVEEIVDGALMISTYGVALVMLPFGRGQETLEAGAQLVGTKLVDELESLIYSSGLGMAMDEASFIKSDSTGAQIIKSSSKSVLKTMIATGLYAFGGGLAAIMVGGLEGIGATAGEYLDDRDIEDVNFLALGCKCLVGMVEGASEYYFKGKGAASKAGDALSMRETLLEKIKDKFTDTEYWLGKGCDLANGLISIFIEGEDAQSEIMEFLGGFVEDVTSEAAEHIIGEIGNALSDDSILPEEIPDSFRRTYSGLEPYQQTALYNFLKDSGKYDDNALLDTFKNFSKEDRQAFFDFVVFNKAPKKDKNPFIVEYLEKLSDKAISKYKDKLNDIVMGFATDQAKDALWRFLSGEEVAEDEFIEAFNSLDEHNKDIIMDFLPDNIEF